MIFLATAVSAFLKSLRFTPCGARMAAERYGHRAAVAAAVKKNHHPSTEAAAADNRWGAAVDNRWGAAAAGCLAPLSQPSAFRRRHHRLPPTNTRKGLIDALNSL